MTSASACLFKLKLLEACHCVHLFVFSLRSSLCRKYTDKEVSTDNRAAWSTVMSSNWPVLRSLVAVYLSIEGSSCELERNLGDVRRFCDSHCGQAQSDSKDIEACVEIKLDGPKSEEEFFERKVPAEAEKLQISKKLQVSLASKVPPELHFTDFSRRVAELWIYHNGRRFHVYTQRKDKGQLRGCRAGSEASLILAQGRARRRLSIGDGRDCEVLGLSRAKFVRAATSPLEENVAFKKNDSLIRFQERTEQIRDKNATIRLNRTRGANPYPVGHGLRKYAFRYVCLNHCWQSWAEGYSPININIQC